MKLATKSFVLFAAMTLSTTMATTIGCDNKEKVLDVETPGGEVEVERDKDTGETEVEVNDN